MSYRPTLTGRALNQFYDLQQDAAAYRALMERLLRLVEEPWDAWPVQPPAGEPKFREAHFGEHGNGLISFYVDDATETVRIFNLVWIA
ncbi:MAG: hypothetical protein GEV09_23365 [Pseudonocardiaceae bacterium]|nr:hypothetical protein [Pseudonocardiaceae bacterium]